MELLYDYFVRGVIEQRIVEDGGPECFQEIPPVFAWTVAIVCSAIYYGLFNRLLRHAQVQIPKQVEPRLYQRVFAVVSLVTYAVQFYYKVATRKGLFMLNPCHINVLIMSYLALKPTTRTTKVVYLCWETWLFGPLLSLVFPHLGGLQNPIEIFIYYLQHILIVPVGIVLLQLRYGLSFPSLRDQIFGFATVTLYQYVILMPVSRLTQVNLNFALCHSHADPGYDMFGYRYFLMGCIYLNVLSLVTRLLFYPARALIRLLLTPKDKPQ